MTDAFEILRTLPVHAQPAMAGRTHRLRVVGLVARPLELDADALAALPQSRITEDFRCSEGWVVPAQEWGGVSVGLLLDTATVLDSAAWVVFSSGRFCFSLPLDEVRHALVALTLDGQPLPSVHGGPTRLVVPGAACFTSIKWLERIDVAAVPAEDTARAIALGRLVGRDAPAG